MENSPLIVAEIGMAHDGSLGLAHSYIDALAATGVDAIKFQMHLADAESSPHESFRVPFSYADASRKDYWQRTAFTLEEWKQLNDHCQQNGLEFMATPFSIEAVNWLEKLGVRRYKVGSGDALNLLLLNRIAHTGKPVILSSGLYTADELTPGFQYLKSKSTDITLMVCHTAYPNPAETWKLSHIKDYRSLFHVKIGYSDHSGTPAASMAAAALGADCIEFHAVFDKRMFGPDSYSSLTMEEAAFAVRSIRQISQSLRHQGFPLENSNELRRMFGRSLAINKSLNKGDKIKMEDLETKKPNGMGIDPQYFEEVIGRELKEDKMKWDFLTWNDLA
jgi:N-acetylneuraminate synthase